MTKEEFDALPKEQQDELRGWYRNQKFLIWMEAADKAKLDTMVGLLKKDYATLGEIRDAVGRGDFDWLLFEMK